MILFLLYGGMRVALATLIFTALSAIFSFVLVLQILGFDLRIHGRSAVSEASTTSRNKKEKEAWIALSFSIVSLCLSAAAVYYFARPRIVTAEKPVEKIVEKLIPQECPKVPEPTKLRPAATRSHGANLEIPPGTTIQATTNAPDSAAVGINTGTVTVNPPLNPYAPIHTYDFNGARRTSEPGKEMLDVGEETSVFQKIVQLQATKNWNGLRDICEEQIKKTPEWLTPYLFAGVAYMNLGEAAKATARLAYVKEKAGGNPANADADRLLNKLQPKN
jgi:hypothetical protein